jgi:putative ABC transport system permease protein
MNTLSLAWRYLWSRPLSAALNVLLLSLGLATVTFLLLLNHQIERAFERDLAGIDLVVGAKSSPLQLILAGVFHVDTPPGNIALAEVRKLEAMPEVAELIPISLGDNFRGHRIVGTTPAYVKHYGATLATGALWQGPMQAVIGAHVARQTGLKVGDSFTGSHGLAGGGEPHGEHAYTVSGVLAPSASVLDRLVLTATESVWQVHESEVALDEEDLRILAEDREITLALVRYASPLAAVSLPRLINSATEMQAAAPAVEIARLLQMLGVGVDVLRALAGVLLLTAGLGVFVALWNAVRERRAELALLRLLGAPPSRVAGLLLCESLWLAGLAAGLGLAAGQGLTALLAWALQLENAWLIGAWNWPFALWVVPALALAVGGASALLPAGEAYRARVFELLQST